MALYLKYRPLDFSSLVGQEFIKSTLKAAISHDKTVGAYIFTGPRGTGKTSTARIFAKAINCLFANNINSNFVGSSFTLKFDEIIKEYNYTKTSFIENYLRISINNDNTYDKIIRDFNIYTSNYTNTEVNRDNILNFIPINYFVSEQNFDLISKHFSSPCGVCTTCNAFSNENLIDVIEIDAASHTGVDNIREIIEKAQFRPTQSKYKIYIIDEVHMLSKGAFNALLKILEEPPKHVKFILATTEIHKVPDTILSRCQRYDFKNFSGEEISGRLKYIAEKEGVSVDEKSYKYIVKSSEGGMRNAVSLFEQLIKDDTISYEHIIQTLGIMSEDEKKLFINKLISRDSSVLDDFDDIASNGKNLKIFFKDILSDIQNQSIKTIQTGGDIAENIAMMDTLSDMLMKSKNSFDEVMTYRIGLLKVISSYVPVSGSVATSKQQTNTPSSSKNISTVRTSSQQTNQDQDLVSSAEDIFAIDTSEAPTQSTGSITQSSSSNSDIDINSLTAACKENGGKAALSMTIKGSTFNLDGDILHISTKTSIAKNTLNKTENRDILFLALEKIGLSVSDIMVS